MVSEIGFGKAFAVAAIFISPIAVTLPHPYDGIVGAVVSGCLGVATFLGVNVAGKIIKNGQKKPTTENPTE